MQSVRREFLVSRIRGLEAKIERHRAKRRRALILARRFGYGTRWGRFARVTVTKAHDLRIEWEQRALERARVALDAHDLEMDHLERVRRGWDLHRDFGNPFGAELGPRDTQEPEG